MTDDPTTPAGPDRPGGSGDAERPRGRRPTWRRRVWIGLGVALAALLIIFVCAAAGAMVYGLTRAAREADQTRDGHARTDAACLDLEKRLNRLMPPGAAANPGQRAAAIRNENAAIRPFLSEIDGLRGVRHTDPDGDGRGWTDNWRQLVDARTAYADALDRQVTNGEPAFFLAPQTRRGTPALDRLQRASPQSCAGAVRRLAAPDL